MPRVPVLLLRCEPDGEAEPREAATDGTAYASRIRRWEQSTGTCGSNLQGSQSIRLRSECSRRAYGREHRWMVALVEGSSIFQP